jgi:hypothetical protein
VCQPVSCTENEDCALGICLGSYTCGCNANNDCDEYSLCNNYACEPVECTADSQCESGECDDNVCTSIIVPTILTPFVEGPTTPSEVPQQTSSSSFQEWWSGITITIKAFIVLLLIIVAYFVFEKGPEKGIFRTKKVIIKHRRGKKK